MAADFYIFGNFLADKRDLGTGDGVRETFDVETSVPGINNAIIV